MSHNKRHFARQDVEEESQPSQSFRRPEMDEQLEAKRPTNHGQTLPFHTLLQDIFDPLDALKPGNQPRRGGIAVRKLGARQVNARTPQQKKRDIIESYITKWRALTGNDFYPVLRLLLPDKDRYRLYGLKEKILAKYIIEILKIDKSSEDAESLRDWKRSGNGDFPARVADAFGKRPHRTKPGGLTIDQVNEKLDALGQSQKEEDQLVILEYFYRNMNANELRWLIKIILKQMHIGTSEKTLLEMWHPDAERLFNVTSDLKRVCWELWNKDIRLENDSRGSLTLGSCIIPQAADNPRCNFEKYPGLLGCTEDEPEFYIEDKLDGERMQLHTWIQTTKIKNKDLGDNEKPEYEPEPPYRIFKFYSRKAKDYTYLYGEFLKGPDSVCAFTRYLENAFHDNLDSAILDGEMITWDPAVDRIVAFGSLKTAALEARNNPYTTGPHPLYRVFDVLYVNGRELINYELKERRKALESAVKSVDRRIEVVNIVRGTTGHDIERELQKIVVAGTEGLVVKNPNAAYILNDRPKGNWLKVKPEYMSDHGQEFDCLIIGGYYGTGRRGGGLSSFLCGLRADSKKGNPSNQKFLSFFKVGGGFTSDDYSKLRAQTEGKWMVWDSKRPPSAYIELAGGARQIERPDMWIKPVDSRVVTVRAGSVAQSDEFAVGMTLRFPRFCNFKDDKDWETAMSYQDFLEQKASADNKSQEIKFMQAHQRAEKNQSRRVRVKPVQVAGYTDLSINEAAVSSQTIANDTTNVFRGLTIFVMTGSMLPRKSKLELEELIKSHGGKIIQTAESNAETDGHIGDIVCIASKRSVGVASLIKRGTKTILQPAWIFDCIDQAKKDTSMHLTEMLLQPELDRHIYFAPEEMHDLYENEVDQYGDSFARDTTVEELKACMAQVHFDEAGDNDSKLLDMIDELPGNLFSRTLMLFVDCNSDSHIDSSRFRMTKTTARFAGAKFAIDLDDIALTHVVVPEGIPSDHVRRMREQISLRQRVPRFVATDWIEQSWIEQTRLDEERFPVS